jgi:iron(III) transport system substrate-binding protein
MKTSYIPEKHLDIPSLFLIPIFLFLFTTSCTATSQNREVVVYTTVDQVYSEPIFKAYEAQSGVKVKPLYDIEATKTTGLVNRLIAEKAKPQADVFWSNEFAQTILLKEKNVLAVYKPKNGIGLPDTLLDTDGYWTGFGGRARILLINTERIDSSQIPHSILGLTSGTTPTNQVGIALPMFGTTATHAAALYAALGTKDAGDYYRKLVSDGIRVVDGNSVVRDLVVKGELVMGMTDTDDACVAITKGDPVKMVFLDQEDGGLGSLLIPNSTALIQGAPHSEEGKKLLEYLASSETEEALVKTGAIQVAARPIKVANPCPIPSDVRWMHVDYEKIYEALQPAQDELKEVYIQ